MRQFANQKALINYAEFELLSSAKTLHRACKHEDSDDKLQNQTVSKNGRFTIHDVSKGIYDLKETVMITILVYFQTSASIRTQNGSSPMQ